ncbi:AtpZ/AtpI family protein [uncultured Cohaesibacter sp.]|uniref:AtpZ/AtpI family protein n=1 Tax=uncultured Cohaesibacter sp. TaxID=1002546 RepID=UPI00292F6871|nr:AtpZ/AtpI family protein [uncultured Cohaesibacter sp.]
MTGKRDSDNPGETERTLEGGKLDNRLEQLDAELAKVRQVRATKLQSEQQKPQSSGLALAWRLGSEFIAGVLVGAGVGWLIDELLGSRPWGLIIFLFLGFLAGMLNMLRAAGKVPPPGA